jgi:hypothetical protein
MTTGTFHTKVAGVSARNDNGESRQDCIRSYCRSGMRVELRREPDNPFDKNAVACWIVARPFLIFRHPLQIGYLPAEIAGEISRALAAGREVHGVITDVTGGSGKKRTLGVNLLITKG